MVVVINSGRMREKGYDAYTGVETLQSAWVSRSSERQRRGRAGRCQPGVAFHLYTRSRSEALAPYAQPELLRTPLEDLALQVPPMGLGLSFRLCCFPFVCVWGGGEWSREQRAGDGEGEPQQTPSRSVTLTRASAPCARCHPCCLQIKLFERPGQPLLMSDFFGKALDPPVAQAVEGARTLLQSIGALSWAGQGEGRGSPQSRTTRTAEL